MNEELEKLKKYLPTGFTRILAREFEVTDVTVCNSLNGKTRRYDIIQRAIEMAKGNLETMKDLKETVGQLESVNK